MIEPGKGLILTEDQKRRRRRRNMAIGVILAVMVALFYVMTLVKLGGTVAGRAV